MVGTTGTSARRLSLLRTQVPRIPRYWLPSARPLFGKLSDHEIAHRLGVARTIVSKARRELGIAPAPRKATTVADRSW